MALTNEQITAKNFKEFYEQIRPYLNGSFPTPVANKMSRGDLYSTNERMIGQWIDGKPIYQKTVDCGALPNNAEKTVAHGIANLGTLVDVIAIANDGNGIQKTLPFVHDTAINNQNILNINPAEVWLRTKADMSRYTAYVTLKYTKTTDTAIKIGHETDYSEDEQIVGSWIDGKNIYQKTVNFGALPNNTTKTVAHNIANIDMITDYKGICFAASGVTTQLNYVDTVYSGAGNIGCCVNKTNIAISCKDNRSTYSAYVTIQYTKTTD